MDANSENLGLKIDNLLSKFDQSQINLVNSIEEKINNLREEFQSTSSDVKRIKLDREFKWKREGNRDQFNFATQISEILNQSVWAIKNKKYDYALENLEEALKNLKSRIKHIKLADSSDAGWDIIKNYVQTIWHQIQTMIGKSSGPRILLSEKPKGKKPVVEQSMYRLQANPRGYQCLLLCYKFLILVPLLFRCRKKQYF